jgi:hypothetical protein
MGNRLRWGAVAMAIVVGAVTGASPSGATAPGEVTPDEGVIATFEGRTLNLAESWGEAQACISDDPRTARCYRSEAEMDAAEGGTVEAVARGSVESSDAVQAACSSSVRLYRLTGFGGGVLQLTTQYTYLNLASYGFDNDTSSYRIGACTSHFYDTTTGGGAYPGNTSANVQASAMVTGWNNRIGSVYIT